MSAFFMLYRLWFQIGAIVALVAAFTWGAHTYNEHFREIGRAEVRAEYKERENEARDNAAKVEAGLRKQLADAISAAARRNQRVDAATASAAAANDSLRAAVDALRDSVPGATASALANAVTTTSALLGTCSERYQGVAGKSDKHANDAQTLHDGWPSYDKLGKPQATPKPPEGK